MVIIDDTIYRSSQAEFQEGSRPLNDAERMAPGQARFTDMLVFQQDKSIWQIKPLAECFLADNVTPAVNRGTWGTLPQHWLDRAGTHYLDVHLTQVYFNPDNGDLTVLRGRDVPDDNFTIKIILVDLPGNAQVPYTVPFITA